MKIAEWIGFGLFIAGIALWPITTYISANRKNSKLAFSRAVRAFILALFGAFLVSSPAAMLWSGGRWKVVFGFSVVWAIVPVVVFVIRRRFGDRAQRPNMSAQTD